MGKVRKSYTEILFFLRNKKGEGEIKYDRWE